MRKFKKGQIVRFTHEWLRHHNDPCDVYRDALWKIINVEFSFIEVKTVNDCAELVMKATDQKKRMRINGEFVELANGLDRAIARANLE